MPVGQNAGVVESKTCFHLKPPSGSEHIFFNHTNLFYLLRVYVYAKLVRPYEKRWGHPSSLSAMRSFSSLACTVNDI